ncbi:hypothetical protein XM53_18705 [Roseovarius atlanticus]|uniref:Protein BatD n=2 Tax=Roseovarius atlanticus TaxID=1641875 RepID=A0A0T5NPR5_9RHOB|nr:hypothetical protein XM53_18705 [Roseovarius atlanticus]
MLGMFALMVPEIAVGQTREVRPGELKLEVSVEERAATPYTREMVLLTIRGTYRRYITRETLVQPELEGFNWSQLGPDTWREERVEGRAVKVFIRRMAVYPERPGTLTIGAFRHQLTLTDEGDDWFAYEIASEPITIEVDPAPEGSDWWFPVRQLQVSDQWSNAPDQLTPGEGVLRVIRIEALGATPEMIPPMPELTSPSGMIFAHPEKRLIQLTPEGPKTIAFWRWTIRPGNDVSAVVEPLSFDYFDTVAREPRTVEINAQRVAYGARVPGSRAEMAATAPAAPVVTEAVLPGFPALGAALAVFAAALLLGLKGRAWSGRPQVSDWVPALDPRRRALRRAARAGRTGEMRQALVALARAGPGAETYRARLAELDRAVYSGQAPPGDLTRFAR